MHSHAHVGSPHACTQAADGIEEEVAMAGMARGLSRLQVRLVDRLLIWLLAPAALEAERYPELAQAEPGLAAIFLQAARRRETQLGQAPLGVDLDQGGWDASEDGARLRWAYAEAGRLLKAYSGLRATLQEQMVAGVSAGDCVVLLEESMKGQVRAV